MEQLRADRGWNRCVICGRFIGFIEFESGRVHTDFTFDEVGAAEDTEHSHKACHEREQAQSTPPLFIRSG